MEYAFEAMIKIKTSNDLTTGAVTKSILLFALPILLSNVFQQFYNIVDTAVIGNVLGDNALASVGAASPIFGLIIGFENGITNGFSVIIARLFGAGDMNKLKRAVSLTYILTISIALTLTAISLIFLNPILRLLKTPETIIDSTAEYLRIIFIFAAVALLYNMMASLLRAIGNSRVPLYFLVASSIVNVVLDIIYVKYLDLGIRGAAYATVIAEIISAVLCLIYIHSKCRRLTFSVEELSFDKKMMRELLSMGFSMGLMMVVVSIGSVALQSTVNSLSDEIIVAHTAARKVDDIFMMPLGTLSSAAATFVSQNYGAGKIDRIKSGIKSAIVLTTFWSALSAVVIFIFGRLMITSISGTENEFVISNAQSYVRINILFFSVLGVLLVMRSSLQGIGRKTVPILGSVVELILKFAAVLVITKEIGYIGVCVLEPIIWILSAIMVLYDFVKNVNKLKKGDIYE